MTDHSHMRSRRFVSMMRALLSRILINWPTSSLLMMYPLLSLLFIVGVGMSVVEDVEGEDELNIKF